MDSTNIPVAFDDAPETGELAAIISGWHRPEPLLAREYDEITSLINL